MNLMTIIPPTPFDAPKNWPAEEDLCACFEALYRRLVWESAADRPLRVVGVTGCRRGAGVSTVAGGLAAAAARDVDARVLLIDASREHVALAGGAGEEMTPGLIDLVAGTHGIDQLLQPSSIDNLWLLPSGNTQSQLAPRGASSQAVEIINGLSHDFSFVVVDMAPVDELSGVIDVSAALDGVVLVIEAESTRRSAARGAKSTLSGSRLLGTVLNKHQKQR
jgi:protein-tyrosine kinase